LRAIVPMLRIELITELLPTRNQCGPRKRGRAKHTSLHVANDSEGDCVGEVFLRTLRDLLLEAESDHILELGVNERFAQQLRSLFVTFPQVAEDLCVYDAVWTLLVGRVVTVIGLGLEGVAVHVHVAVELALDQGDRWGMGRLECVSALVDGAGSVMFRYKVDGDGGQLSWCQVDGKR
jgi:hypothetical protein